MKSRTIQDLPNLSSRRPKNDALATNFQYLPTQDLWIFMEENKFQSTRNIHLIAMQWVTWVIYNKITFHNDIQQIRAQEN